MRRLAKPFYLKERCALHHIVERYCLVEIAEETGDVAGHMRTAAALPARFCLEFLHLLQIYKRSRRHHLQGWTDLESLPRVLDSSTVCSLLRPEEAYGCLQPREIIFHRQKALEGAV